jgi:predicted ester cyclase
MGVPASGKPFSGTGISIYRIADDKIVEHWAEADFLGLAQQLVFRLKNGLATSQLRHDGLR